MTKRWEVVYNCGLSREEFCDFAAAGAFAEKHPGATVEPLVRAKGFRLRTIERINGKPVQVIPATEASR